jgi:hypothetical protein
LLKPDYCCWPLVPGVGEVPELLELPLLVEVASLVPPELVPAPVPKLPLEPAAEFVLVRLPLVP